MKTLKGKVSFKHYDIKDNESLYIIKFIVIATEFILALSGVTLTYIYSSKTKTKTIFKKAEW